MKNPERGQEERTGKEIALITCSSEEGGEREGELTVEDLKWVRVKVSVQIAHKFLHDDFSIIHNPVEKRGDISIPHVIEVECLLLGVLYFINKGGQRGRYEGWRGVIKRD